MAKTVAEKLFASRCSDDPRRDKFKFSLPDFDRALASAGGWAEYADNHC
jgi:hypothetical protein